MTVVDPRDFGAAGDGRRDDTGALQRAIDSLEQTGGVVFIADGMTFKTSDVVEIAGDHVKLWARSGRGGITAGTNGQKRRQAIICQDVDGCGLYGLRLRSDASRRLLAREDSAIVLDGVDGAEVVGVDIGQSASAGVFVYGRARRIHVEGNYIHDGWADSIHFTNGSRQAWVWDNTLHNRGDRRGDDGVACVTYKSEPRCGEMEWWRNTHLGTGWGRGLSVVGGEQIEIHHNFVRDISGAGIIVASEPSYDTPGSDGIVIHNNVLFRTGQVVPQPGILVSALSGPIRDVTVRDNTVIESANGETFRQEGDTAGVQHNNTDSSRAGLPTPLPTPGSGQQAKRTDVLRMRDTSFVDPSHRRGLYRIQVRSAPGSNFRQRFEYVLAGQAPAMDRWLGDLELSAVTYRQTTAGETVAVVLSAQPVTAPTDLRPIDFGRLRAGDKNGTLSRLWAHLNQ